MNSSRASRDAEHFQRLYDASPDPWQFRTSDYEQVKYRKTVASLAGRHFRSCFEVGCSIGVLTHLLAAQCDALLAVDIVEQPLIVARATCADQPWVRFAQMHVPAEWPDDDFDLIVLSEVLYFLSPSDIAILADRVRLSVVQHGLVLLVNWRGQSDDPCTGDEAADCFIRHAQGPLISQTRYRAERYRLDIITKA